MLKKYCELNIISFFIVLKFVQPAASEPNFCAPGNIGYKECERKMAVCHIENDSFVCKCPEGIRIGNEDSDKCEDICAGEGRGYRFCASENALCKIDPNVPEGFKCVCPEGMVREHTLCTEPTALTTGLSSVSLITGIENTQNEALSTTDYAVSTLSSVQTTTSSASVSSTLDNEECSNQCSKNATCVKLKHGFICICKTGFVQYEDVPVTKKHCTRNCMQSSCEEICKQMKCLLREDKDKESVTDMDIENKFSGWPISATLTCILLGCLLIIFISLSVYALHRNMKLRKSQQLAKNQIIYQRMNQGVQSESVSESLQSGFVVVSYVCPPKGLSKISNLMKSSHC